MILFSNDAPMLSMISVSILRIFPRQLSSLISLVEPSAECFFFLFPLTKSYM